MAKFCGNCGKELPDGAVACPSCGAKTGNASAKTESAAPPVIVNVENHNNNVNANANAGTASNLKNKWIALILWFFFGWCGGHKFYEGKIGMGILYLFTGGLFGIGLIIDFFALLFKPTHYSP